MPLGNITNTDCRCPPCRSPPAAVLPAAVLSCPAAACNAAGAAPGPLSAFGNPTPQLFAADAANAVCGVVGARVSPMISGVSVSLPAPIPPPPLGFDAARLPSAAAAEAAVAKPAVQHAFSNSLVVSVPPAASGPFPAAHMPHKIVDRESQAAAFAAAAATAGPLKKARGQCSPHFADCIQFGMPALKPRPAVSSPLTDMCRLLPPARQARAARRPPPLLCFPWAPSPTLQAARHRIWPASFLTPLPGRMNPSLRRASGGSILWRRLDRATSRAAAYGPTHNAPPAAAPASRGPWGTHQVCRPCMPRLRSVLYALFWPAACKPVQSFQY